MAKFGLISVESNNWQPKLERTFAMCISREYISISRKRVQFEFEIFVAEKKLFLALVKPFFRFSYEKLFNV